MEIRKITIAGAGTMGYSMAEIFARKGYDVILWNHRSATLERAKTKIAPDMVNHISYTTDPAAFRGRDLIVENIVEDLAVKSDFYQTYSPLADEQTIIATNTSGLSINTLAKSVKGPERFLGMHWFNPPTLIPLIEIIKNDHTQDKVAKTIYDLALSMVKKGIISKEGIDAVMKYGLGFRWACLGPLETADFGGLDVFAHISEYLMPDLEDSHEVPSLLAEKVKEGHLGVKTGEGFYRYDGDKAARATRERDRKLKALYDALYK